MQLSGYRQAELVETMECTGPGSPLTWAAEQRPALYSAQFTGNVQQPMPTPGMRSLPSQVIQQPYGQSCRQYKAHLMQRLQTTANHVLFYLIDTFNQATLAVVGTDVRLSGHFTYVTLPEFVDGPPIRVTNRARVMEWLAAMGGEHAADAHLVRVPPIDQAQLDKLLTNDPMFSKPAVAKEFTSWREEGGKLPDGRHYKHFYLVAPSTGTEQLIISAEDSHRCDRRYTYKATPEFGGFAFENGEGAKSWLDFVVGKGPAHPVSNSRSAPRNRAAPVQGTTVHVRGSALSRHVLKQAQQHQDAIAHQPPPVWDPSGHYLDMQESAARGVPWQDCAKLLPMSTGRQELGQPLEVYMADGPWVTQSAPQIVFGLKAASSSAPAAPPMLPQFRPSPAGQQVWNAQQVFFTGSEELDLSKPIQLGRMATLPDQARHTHIPVGGSEGQMLGHASPPWVHSQSTPRPQHFHSSGQVTFPGQAEPELALAESAITNHAGAQGEGTCEVQRAFAEDYTLLHWVTHTPDAAALARVEAMCSTLKLATAAASAGPLLGMGGPSLDAAAAQAVSLLTQLVHDRDLCLRLLETSEVGSLVASLASHAHPGVASIAAQVSSQWRNTAAAALHKAMAGVATQAQSSGGSLQGRHSSPRAAHSSSRLAQ